MEEKILELLSKYPRHRSDILALFEKKNRRKAEKVFTRLAQNGVITDMFSDGRYVVVEDLRKDSNY